MRDVAPRHWTGGACSEDVALVHEAIDARGLLPREVVPWSWWQSCPSQGTPQCDFRGVLPGSNVVISEPRDSCGYCRGAGMLLREPQRARDVDALVFLAALGADRAERVLATMKDLGEKLGSRVDRVAWSARGVHENTGRTPVRQALLGAEDVDGAFARYAAIEQPEVDCPYGFRPQRIRRGTAVVDLFMAQHPPPLDLRRRLPALGAPVAEFSGQPR